jgi:hypothetical protein
MLPNGVIANPRGCNWHSSWISTAKECRQVFKFGDWFYLSWLFSYRWQVTTWNCERWLLVFVGIIFMAHGERLQPGTLFSSVLGKLQQCSQFYYWSILLHWYNPHVLITIYNATIYANFNKQYCIWFTKVSYNVLMLLKYVHSRLKWWLHVLALKGHLQATHVIDKEVHCTVCFSISLLNGH